MPPSGSRGVGLPDLPFFGRDARCPADHGNRERRVASHDSLEKRRGSLGSISGRTGIHRLLLRLVAGCASINQRHSRTQRRQQRDREHSYRRTTGRNSSTRVSVLRRRAAESFFTERISRFQNPIHSPRHPSPSTPTGFSRSRKPVRSHLLPTGDS